MKHTPKKDQRDWVQFWVHFVFGFVLGAIIGLVAFTRTPFAASDSVLPLLLFVGLTALGLGIVAGFCGDELWRNILKLF